MRAIGLSFALIVAGVSAAGAQTLLETVLYIVSLHEPRERPNFKDTVTLDGESIYGEMVMLQPGWPIMHVRRTLVKRIGDCRFEVNDKIGDYELLHAIYDIDFSLSDLEGVHFAEAKNTLGNVVPAMMIIPGTRYCLLAGRPSYNDIGPGSCADAFFVEAAEGSAKMLAAIHRLRGLCERKVSRLNSRS